MKPIRTLLSLLIVTFHFGTLIFFYANKPSATLPKKRLVVTTKKLAPPVKKPPQKQTPKPKPAPKPKPIQKPKPKPVSKPKPKPKPAPKPTRTKKKTQSPPPTQTEPVIPQNLLKELEESIAKIDEKPHKESAKSHLIVPTLSKSSRNESTFNDTAYHHKLIDCLHRALSLPEHGEVTIELELNRRGDVARLNVVQAASTTNRAYLEKHLPQVTFPPLDGVEAKNGTRTFVITFCNEI